MIGGWIGWKGSGVSLEAWDDRGVPELTARVVRASFPKGTLAVRIRDALRSDLEVGSGASGGGRNLPGNVAEILFRDDQCIGGSQ